MLEDIYSDRVGTARMEALATAFGLTQAELSRIFDVVLKQALASGRQVRAEQMLEQVRNRIHLARR